MPVSIDAARRELARFNQGLLLNLFAQAHAQRVLLEVGESRENFPPFDVDLDDRVTWAAHEIIAAACTLAETGERAEAGPHLHRGAELLEHIHGRRATTEPPAAFHVLVAAMAFYAAGQYSRAFVAMRTAEVHTPTARPISAFLKRDIPAAIRAASEVVLVQSRVEFHGEAADIEVAIAVAVARAIHLALEYAHSGDRALLDDALKCASDAGVIARYGRSPAWWLVARLLRLMLQDLGEASLWHQLPPYFPPVSSAKLDRYVRLHALGRRPAWELWQSQLDALPHALSANRGAVLNLRTSAGKTRLAELAILQTLLANPDAKVLYLAPYRSLALEVEHTLNATLGVLGFTVSHLYGGSRVSSVDTRAAAESAITIATPEKARALVRAAPDLLANVKLAVVDEGHLLGLQERLIRNEIFLDHLRAVAKKTGARMLLLSAVLPNASQLATWVTGDEKNLARSKWKPSAERLGLLLWNGQRVYLDWRGDVQSFNPRFVERATIPGTRKQFPKNKNEAIAASAVRLSASGPVMIFSAKVVSIEGLARAVLTAGAIAKLPPHNWDAHEWRVFEAICREDLPDDAIELEAARAGTICHHAQLPPQVRFAMEHLIRATPPRIIIATMTLAQGVNVGISSVIVASVTPGKEPISKRDFWNICGRAGRAFVDGEGRVLYAVDETSDKAAKQKVIAPQGVAYQRMLKDGVLDRCGVTLLAEKAVGAPFVGTVAASLALAEVLRLLHGGPLHSVVDLDLQSVEHRSAIAHGHDFARINPGFIRLGTT